MVTAGIGCQIYDGLLKTSQSAGGSYHRGYEVDQLAGSLGQLDELNILSQGKIKPSQQLEFSLMLRPHNRITDEYRGEKLNEKMKVSLRGQTHFTLRLLTFQSLEDFANQCF